MTTLKHETLSKIYEEKQNLSNGRNSILLSDPGMGLYSIMKMEIEWLLQNTEDEIFIIDKYGEFSCFYNDERTTLHKLSMTDGCINPLDMNLACISDKDYLYDKFDFLVAFIEQIERPLSPKECAILEKAFLHLCFSFEMKNKSKVPTISDLLAELSITVHNPNEYEKEAAKTLFDMLIIIKDIPCFYGQTAISHNTRLTILDINELGPLTDIGMLCCLEFINQLSNLQSPSKKHFSIFAQDVNVLKDNSKELTNQYILSLWKRNRMANRSFTFTFGQKIEHTSGIMGRSIHIESYQNIQRLLANAPDRKSVV